MADQAQDAGAISPSNNVSKLDDERGKRWQSKLRKVGGKYKKTLFNAAATLKHAPEFRGALEYDVHALLVCITRPLPWASALEKSKWKPRPWTDQDDRKFAEWLQEHDIDVSSDLAGDAAHMVARDKEFHPVQDYLNSLKWDGVERLGSWLTVYLGAKKTNYTTVVGVKYLVSAVARIMRPGCKADCLLQLHGAQGIGKGTALETLAVKPRWFSDEVRDIGGKEAAIGLAGRWIVEFAELDAFTGKSAETKKAFISRTVDRFRPHYGRAVTDNPRQCVFAATTNRQETLDDASGNRRFWPVTCEKIDIAALKRDRDQLWAEAKARFDQGETWWMDTAESQRWASEAQEEHYEPDYFEDELAAFLTGKTETTSKEVICQVLDIEPSKVDRKVQKRVANMLQHLGWERFRKRNGVDLSWAYRPIKPNT